MNPRPVLDSEETPDQAPSRRATVASSAPGVRMRSGRRSAAPPMGGGGGNPDGGVDTVLTPQYYRTNICQFELYVSVLSVKVCICKSWLKCWNIRWFSSSFVMFEFAKIWSGGRMAHKVPLGKGAIISIEKNVNTLCKT